jgi:hypothetical protein
MVVFLGMQLLVIGFTQVMEEALPLHLMPMVRVNGPEILDLKILLEICQGREIM